MDHVSTRTGTRTVVNCVKCRFFVQVDLAIDRIYGIVAIEVLAVDIRRRYAWWIRGLPFLFSAGLALDVFAFQQKWISLQAFRVATALIIIGFFGSMILLIKRSRSLPETPGIATETSELPSIWIRLRIWLLKGMIAMMIFCLFYANWVERSAPLLPRVVGSIANIGMTWLFFKNLRLLEKRRQSFPTNDEDHLSK